MLDNGVACCVVISCFAVAAVCVEDIGVAAVVVNSQILAVLLEDVACMCCISTAGKVGYMAAGKAARNLFAVLLVCPGCTICQPQIKGAIAGGIITGSNFVEAAAVPAAVFALQCQINGRRSRSCFILPIIIGFCRLGVDIAINLDNACTCLAILNIDVDNTIIVRIQRNVISCLAILLNIQITVHGNSSAAATVNAIAFCLGRGRNSGVCVNSNLTAGCINTLGPEAGGISAELQTLSLNSNVFGLSIAEAGSYRTCNIAALKNMVGYVQTVSVGINRNRSAAGFNSTQVGAVITLGYINNCIIGEVVNSFFGFNSQTYILFIKIAGDWISNNRIVHFGIFIEALTRCLGAGCIGGEADIAGLQGCGRSS